jgi:predicted PurR-regulated permease PerM
MGSFIRPDAPGARARETRTGRVTGMTGPREAAMSTMPRSTVDRPDGPLLRLAALCLLGGTAVLTLYFGRDVLLPCAVAVLLAFVLGGAVSFLNRALPLSLSVAVVVLAAIVFSALLAVLISVQLAEVAGSLTSYQANLYKKVQDIREILQGGGAVGRFMAMLVALGQELTANVEAVPERVVHVQADAGFERIAALLSPLIHPVLSISIVIVLVVFILLDREHLSDQIVRLFGANDVHATSEAIADAAHRLGRVLSLQVVTNLGFAGAVGIGLFALGLPNAALWGLLAGGFRFVPYIGAAVGALLPTLIAFAIMPGWLHPLLVLGWIVLWDVIIGQIIEPVLFGDSVGVTPLALVLSAILWGTLWGPVGILLSTPLTICLLVLGRHVPQLRFLQILLGHEPALTPYQRIYGRLIRRAVVDASNVALAEIEEKGAEKGLDDAMGRMVVLAETDRALDRLSAAQIEAIVDGTDEILDFIDVDPAERGPPAPLAVEAAARVRFVCVGGRGQIDDAAAAIVAYALRRTGFDATRRRHGGSPPIEPEGEGAQVIPVVCYASRPSPALRRYTSRKLGIDGGDRACHVVIDYEVASAPVPPLETILAARGFLAGDVATICRVMTQHAVAVATPAAMSVAAGN